MSNVIERRLELHPVHTTDTDRMEASTAEQLKRQAAASALEYVQSGMILGLGTGSTVVHFLDLLGHRIRTGELKNVVGVPTLSLIHI